LDAIRSAIDSCHSIVFFGVPSFKVSRHVLGLMCDILDTEGILYKVVPRNNMVRIGDKRILFLNLTDSCTIDKVMGFRDVDYVEDDSVLADSRCFESRDRVMEFLKYKKSVSAALKI
jgi:hypothetical protein